MKHASWKLPLLSLMLVTVAGCSQSDAPSEKMGEAAEQLVQNVLETPAPDAVPVGPFAPRNDCGEEEGADTFLAMLRGAVEMRDTDVLVALAANDVKLGFGGQDGSANLRRALDAPDSNLWDQISELSSMGCAVNSQGGITLPWYFAQDIGGDPFDTMIVTSTNVAMHEAPREDSPRVALLSWDAVEVVRATPPAVVEPATMDGDQDNDGWTHVRLIPHGASDAGGEAQEAVGYVRSDTLRSVIDYRMLASSRNGRWRITGLLAGD